MKTFTNILLLLSINLFSFAQANGNFTNLNEANQTPSAVTELDLSGLNLSTIPTDVYRYTNLERLV